jgi:hypothetical protein
MTSTNGKRSQFTPTLDTVYKLLTGKYGNRPSQTYPSFEVTSAGAVNMYISNAVDKPADSS